MTRRRSLLTRLNCTPLEAREVPTVARLADVAPAPAIENQSASSIVNTTLAGFTYFVGSDAEHGRELWRTNGAIAELVADLSPGSASTDVRKIVVAGGKVVFAADPEGGVLGAELFVTDGTAANTKALVGTSVPGPSNPLVSISTVAGLTASGDDVAWAGFVPDGNDGLRQGAFRTNVVTGQTSSLEFGNVGNIDDANNFVILSGGVIFTARSTTQGRGLFGTFTPRDADPQQPVTVRLLTDEVFNPIQTIVKVNDDQAAVLLPKADNTFELYATSAGSTRQIRVPAGTTLLGGLVAAGGRAFFTARGADGTDELWATDDLLNTATRLRGGLNPESPDAPLRILRTDGNKLYFPASDGEHGIEMWVSDGTVDGTRMLADLNSGSKGSVDQYLQTAAPVIPQPAGFGFAYFLATPGGSGSAALYRTDGTTAGTLSLEKGTTVANFAVTPEFYIGTTNALVLFRSDAGDGPKLWKADPNPATAAAATAITLRAELVATDGTIPEVPYVANLTANVTSPGGRPEGTVRFQFYGQSFDVPLDNTQTARTQVQLSPSRLTDLLADGPSSYSAEFMPSRSELFAASSTSRVELTIPPELLAVDTRTTLDVAVNITLNSLLEGIRPRVTANVTSSRGSPNGEMRFAIGDGEIRTEPVVNGATAEVELPTIPADSILGLLNGTTTTVPTFAAAFVPSDLTKFNPSLVSAARVRLNEGVLVMAVTPITPTPVGQSLTLRTALRSDFPGIGSTFTFPGKVQYIARRNADGQETILGSAAVANNVATLATTAPTAIGDYTITARYSVTDAIELASTTTALSVTPESQAEPTTLRLTATAERSGFANILVRLTATVGSFGGQPMGTVNFTSSDGLPISADNQGRVTTVNGQQVATASAEFSAFTFNIYSETLPSFTAIFTPDNGNFLGSSTSVVQFDLSEDLLRLSLPSSNPTEVRAGSRVPLSALVTVPEGLIDLGSLGTPAGTVAFRLLGPNNTVRELGGTQLQTTGTSGQFSAAITAVLPSDLPVGAYELRAALRVGTDIELASASGSFRVNAASTSSRLGSRFVAVASGPEVTVNEFDGISGVSQVMSRIQLAADFAKNAEIVAATNASGQPTVAIGTGPGAASQVQFFDGLTGKSTGAFTPFEPTFLGGIYVVKGDLDGDGEPETIISPNEGGGPRVIVLDGKTNQVRFDFFGIDDPAFRGGARCATADVSGDGVADLIVAAGFQGGPRVAVYDGQSIVSAQPVKLFNDFFAFEQSLRNGIFVAGGDVDGDGFADIIAGGGPGGAPRVFVISGKDLVASGGGTLTPVANFFAGDITSRTGVRVAVKNIGRDTFGGTSDNLADIVTAEVGSQERLITKALVYFGSNLLQDPNQPDSQELSGDFTDGLRIG